MTQMNTDKVYERISSVFICVICGEIFLVHLTSALRLAFLRLIRIPQR